MAYDEPLANRIAALLEATPGITSKRMFGGIAFMHRDYMFIGVNKDDLMVRVGPEAHDSAIAKPGAREMDFTGRPMRGYLFVDATGYKTEKQLQAWVDAGLSFVGSLPEKKPKAPKKKA